VQLCWLYALTLFLTQSTFVPECLVLHPEAYKSQKHKEKLQAARRDSVQSVLNSMRRNSSIFVPFPVGLRDVRTPAAVIAAPAQAEAPNAAVLFEDRD
jgi:hypothetical protein